MKIIQLSISLPCTYCIFEQICCIVYLYVMCILVYLCMDDIRIKFLMSIRVLQKLQISRIPCPVSRVTIFVLNFVQEVEPFCVLCVRNSRFLCHLSHSPTQRFLCDLTCKIIVSALVPVPFLWTLDLDLGLGFGTWTWTLA